MKFKDLKTGAIFNFENEGLSNSVTWKKIQSNKAALLKIDGTLGDKIRCYPSDKVLKKLNSLT